MYITHSEGGARFRREGEEVGRHQVIEPANTAQPWAGHPVPFFVMGSPRSGTTLAAQILDSHSRLSVYIEMNYYGTFYPTIRMYGDLRQDGNRRRFIADVLRLIRLQRAAAPGLDEVDGALLAPTFEGVLEALIQLQARQQGKVRGGEKTPLHYKYLTEIVAGFPRSPVIFLMRDPRDVVLSMRKAWNSSIYEATQVWNEAFLRFTEATASNVHLVRYEELVHDPGGTAERMCKALGEVYEPEMLQPSRRIPEQLKAIGHLDLTRLSGPVVTSSIGNYKEMTAQDIREIEAACAMGMEAMGYEFSVSAPRITVPVVQRPGLVLHFYRRLRYYGRNPERWRRGMFRWKIALRVRVRYLLTLGFLRTKH